MAIPLAVPQELLARFGAFGVLERLSLSVAALSIRFLSTP